jgi:hypothetical protein
MAARPRPGRVVGIVAIAIVGALLTVGSSGCVGQLSRNDDHVGPTSVRPDARPHS